ncbi:MAG: 30S ribosomal protein S13 [Nanohaloarchaea archaeon]|nr:30S ribosomal protein S13 [Candidatus Nanohaloarchaea archaeon]
MAKNDIKTDKLKTSPKNAAASSGGSRPKIHASKNIIRIKGTDIFSDKKLSIGLTAITGVDYNLSRAVLHVGGFDQNSLVESLSEKDIEKIETIIETPTKFGIPAWLVNRRNDYVTGDDMHLIGSDIRLTLRDDINRLRKIRAYRGIRHELGLPVRGQRTKSSFRKGGVASRKKK